MLEKLDVTRKSIKSEHTLEPQKKETQNGFKDLNVRPETIKSQKRTQAGHSCVQQRQSSIKQPTKWEKYLKMI